MRAVCYLALYIDDNGVLGLGSKTSCYCRAELKQIWPGSGMTKERQWFQTSNLIQSRRGSKKFASLKTILNARKQRQLNGET